MNPKPHILLGLVFSLIVWFLIPNAGWLGFILIFLSTFICDVDHYIYYVIKKKDFNFIKCLKWYTDIEKRFNKIPRKEKTKVYSVLCIFHGSEILALLILLSFLFPIVLLILIGLLFHEFLDFIDTTIEGESYDKLVSFFYSVYSSKNKTFIYDYKLKNER